MADEDKNLTPMFRQYLDIKKAYPGTLLFFRLGDFYELFGDDAQVGSRELQITLTARQKDSPNPIPMCGVPHHAAASYIARLVRKGYRVAICEQAEPAGKGVKLVKREVVRVITPGTVVDELLVENGEFVYLAAVSNEGDCVGAAFLELSTGELSATEAKGSDAWQRIRGVIEQFSPKEVIISDATESNVRSNLGFDRSNSSPMFASEDEAESQFGTRSEGSSILTPVETSLFDIHRSEASLTDQFHVRDLSGFGLDGKSRAICAAGACLEYARATQKASVEHISEIAYFETNDFLVLDATTVCQSGPGSVTQFGKAQNAAWCYRRNCHANGSTFTSVLVVEAVDQTR